MYSALISEVDANDNGVNQAPDLIYNIKTSLDNRIGRLNPYDKSQNQHVQFRKALFIAEEEFLWKLKATQNRMKAFTLCQKVFNERHSFYESGEIMLINEHFAWKSALFEVEREAK